MPNKPETKLSKILTWFKNHTIFSIIILVFIVVVGVGQFFDALTKIQKFFSPTPTPTPSVTVTPPLKPSPTPTPKLTPLPTLTPTLIPTVTPKPTPTLSTTPTPTPTPTPSPTMTPTPVPTLTLTPISTVTPEITPPSSTFHLTRVILKDTSGNIITLKNKVYSIKFGKTVTITVDFTNPHNHNMMVSWTTYHGKIPFSIEKTNIYQTKKPDRNYKGGDYRDYITACVRDKDTGERQCKTLLLHIIDVP